MQKAVFGLLEIEGINGVLDFVRFRPALPAEKTPDGSEGFARGRVVLPDEQEAFAQRRLQLVDIQGFSGGGLKEASGYAAMACSAAARTLAAVVT